MFPRSGGKRIRTLLPALAKGGAAVASPMDSRFSAAARSAAYSDQERIPDREGCVTMFLPQGWREIRAGIPVFGQFRQNGVTKAPTPDISGIKARLGPCIVLFE